MTNLQMLLDGLGAAPACLVTVESTQGSVPREPGAWDGDMVCYPHLTEIDGRIVLLYNGNAFGREGFGAAVLEA